ncbi:MAG: hypothetical protein FJ194_15705 [Gammaproteobacteria bacterium]|nr:hypothetical protein [Gammaproteobacteria bacterium]
MDLISDIVRYPVTPPPLVPSEVPDQPILVSTMADSYEIWLKATRKKLAAGALEAAPPIRQGEYDAAELLMRRINNDIYGAVALDDLFTRALEEIASDPTADISRAEELFTRARRWRVSSPTPHTADEAERDRRHAASVEAELTAVLASINDRRP